MANKFEYPIILTPDEKDGGFVVTFPDIDHAVTQGDSIDECLEMANDCLEEVLAAFIDDKEDIPTPSAITDYSARPGAQVALKVELYLAWKAAGISKVEFAARMGIKESEVRRILDPRYGTKLPTMEQALQALGKHIELNVA